MATDELDNVKKRFGRNQVIHGVSIDIDDGEFIVIVGPSGCGKSTLLRMVAGLETVTSGEVRIGDRRVNDLEPMDRDIAMVFQNYALYPHMSVRQNMAYGLKIAGTPKAEIAERVEQAAQLLQIGSYLDRRPRDLSGGQRQRVAMGRAIVRKPAVFLFDEPLSNLDAKLRVQMRLEIKELQRKLGVTALYVTHDQVEAMTLADRVIVMNAGRAEQVGTPLEVYRNPASSFVGGFIGSPPMNFVSARSMGLGGTPPARAVIAGIRPEHLVRDESNASNLSGRIKFTEALGAETIVHAALDSGEMIAWRCAGQPDGPTGSGAPIRLRALAESVCWFDGDGRRLD